MAFPFAIRKLCLRTIGALQLSVPFSSYYLETASSSHDSA